MGKKISKMQILLKFLFKAAKNKVPFLPVNTEKEKLAAPNKPNTNVQTVVRSFSVYSACQVVCAALVPRCSLDSGWHMNTLSLLLHFDTMNSFAQS